MFIERVKYYCVSLLCEKRSKLVRLNPKSLSPDLTKPKGHGHMSQSGVCQTAIVLIIAW